MARGRPPDHERRRLVAEMLGQGLTLAEIGRQLGISRQAVFSLIDYAPFPAPRGVPCTACGVLIPFPTPTPTDRPGALCLACLGRTPGATAEQRLRAYRLAAGLSRADLAWLAGVRPGAAERAEREQGGMNPDTLTRLARVLGQPAAHSVLALRPPPALARGLLALAAVARAVPRGVTAGRLRECCGANPKTVAGHLRRAGLVQCGMGPGHGYRLTRPAVDISLLDLAEAVGWSAQLELPAMPVKGGDGLHRRLQAACDEATEAGRAALQAVSLADLLEE
jgi:DNA-binding IscR family transcriptional regulator/DNA-binding XRE family transcriptional regulator